MSQILTLTLNPALDLATEAASVLPGPKLRCAAERAEPGGGGVNVARAIRHLGGAALAAVALGGARGEALAALLAQAGLDTLRLDGPGETRLSFAVTDRATHGQYRFVLPGPVWSDAAMDQATETLSAAADPEAIVVLSGSMPPGADTGFCTRMVAALGPGRRVVIDTSGPHLAALAAGPQPCPEILRMDSEEAETLTGRALPSRGDSADFAEALRAGGAARYVIVARGADGSVMAGPNGRVHVSAADVPVQSKIGAGDSFVGGFVLALSRGQPAREALRMGAAAASAACMTKGTELCRKSDVARLLPDTVLTSL
ncbi:1-phosphofructokinase family hexose kinase [Cognatishimia sp. F0-27]|uniref:1-phosphofructokinase family hexose kinase n=1 Tax=Cognatishimia sp. F0-27 TaxID=2816855 RepID=UPI001D0C2F08|nr:hexose kinase [Cognatishimia sp. F0-27]MCC1493774.1 hexose kinase [Cognatishimia sp. F0-27]